MKRVLMTPNKMPNVVFFFFLTGTKEVYSFYMNIFTETFLLDLCSFNNAENANIVGTQF